MEEVEEMLGFIVRSIEREKEIGVVGESLCGECLVFVYVCWCFSTEGKCTLSMDTCF